MTANEKDYELGFWGNCCNTYIEETKQYVYARLMGIRCDEMGFTVNGASIIDIGGGPVSMLLKCRDLGKSLVVDPLGLQYPSWTMGRYTSKHIGVIPFRGEDLRPNDLPIFDEVWIYNVLQHVDDPELVVKNALAVCRKLRIFEWVDMPPEPGHPHELKRDKLDAWLGSEHRGDVVFLNSNGCFGKAYYNVVPGLAR